MSGAARLERRPDLHALRGYHSPQLDVEVRLNTNESPYPPPPAFVRAWLDALSQVPLNRYPDRGAHALRTALAHMLGRTSGEVFCANGSNEVLQTLLLAFGGPGRRALLFEPTYTLHAHVARLTGTSVAAVSRADDFTLDPDVVGESIRRLSPQIVFLCSPNNPSGTVDDPAVAQAALDALAAGSPGLLVVDEAYGEFARSSALTLRSDALVVVRTYSKVWSLAALRLGYCVAPEWVVAEMEDVALPYHLDAATQAAGLLALNYVPEMEARVAELMEERERLFVTLNETSGITVFPSGANFLLFRVDEDGHEVWGSLADRGVLIRDFSGQPGLEGCVRVTVGTRSENDAFLTALGEALAEAGTREDGRS